ncbi:MAG: hypothetical protein ACRCUX_15985, partial [Beijerinckiaceae bacterium]
TRNFLNNSLFDFLTGYPANGPLNGNLIQAAHINFAETGFLSRSNNPAGLYRTAITNPWCAKQCTPSMDARISNQIAECNHIAAHNGMLAQCRPLLRIRLYDGQYTCTRKKAKQCNRSGKVQTHGCFLRP